MINYDKTKLLSSIFFSLHDCNLRIQPNEKLKSMTF